jgi:Tol biopolymer transport system component
VVARLQPFLFPLLLVTLLLPSAVEAQYFGKNKVQYKDLDWRVLETPHFEILFYEQESDVVDHAARMAETAYERLSRTLRHEFEDRIPLILYASHADFQSTHITPSRIDTGTGGITELVRRRVFLPFTGSYVELQHVLTHELVHAFELDILMQGAAAGGGSPFGLLPPLWVMEGMAEFLSMPIDDPHTDMWLRDGALSGHLVPPAQMHLVGDIRVYRYGQAIFRSFARRWGATACGDLLRALRDQPASFGEAFFQATGSEWETFSSNWVTEVRREYLPEIADHAVASEFARPLVRRQDVRAAMLLVPSISPDGDRIAYVSDQGLTRDLYLRDLSTGEDARRLVRGDINGDFESLRFFNASASWSPDGRLLAFPAQRGGRDALYLFDVERHRVVRRIELDLDGVQTPSFSPDGQELVFVGLDAGTSNLYRVGVDGEGLQQLTQDRSAVRDPQWAPDGRSVVYVTDSAAEVAAGEWIDTRFRLQLLDLRSGRSRDITPFARGKAVSPAWSGDAESIAFVSDQDGISNIYILHLPTGQVFRLTDSVTGISGILPTSPALSWSRESGRLVFTAFSNAGWDIYGIDDPARQMRPVDMSPGRVQPRDQRVAWLRPPPTQVASMTSDAGAATLARQETSGSGDIDPVDQQFVERPYRSRFRPDLSNVGGVVGFQSGVGGQSLVSFSDLLGNQVWTLGLGIYGSFRDSDLLVSYTNRSRRINWSVAAFQVRRRSGFLSDGSLQMSGQSYRGVRVTATRPRNSFSRLEASLQFANVTGRYGLDPTISDQTVDARPRTFVSPGVAYVVDTALFGATGPILGKRLRLSFEAGVGELSYQTFEADLRRYWNLSRRYTVAARAYVGLSRGGAPQTFTLGGAHTLRGYSYGALVGSRAALLSTEFRFPLLEHLALGWPLPLELYNVRGALFADAASAWDGSWFRTSRAFSNRFLDRGPQISYGVGGRINLGSFVLKVDWAWLFDPDRRGTTPATSVAIGTDF